MSKSNTPKRKKSIRSKVDKVAATITKAVGAKNLARYAGETIARRKNPKVKRTVTGKQALKSAGKLVANVAPVGALGVVGRVAKVANKTRKLNKARKIKKAKQTRATKRSNAYIKRTYSGHEKAAMRQAARRNRRK